MLILHEKHVRCVCYGQNGRAEVSTEDAVSALRRAAKWAQMGLVVSTGSPPGGTVNTATTDKKKTQTDVICREKNAELARYRSTLSSNTCISLVYRFNNNIVIHLSSSLNDVSVVSRLWLCMVYVDWMMLRLLVMCMVWHFRLKWYGHVMRTEDNYVGRREMGMEV